MIKLKKGFTLIELLVVISIIGVLSSVVLASLRSARDKAIAVKFVADFNSIAKGWALWQADTGSDFLNENIYSETGPCGGYRDEPGLSTTDIYINKAGLAEWNGPYVSSVKDPFGLDYSYDYDGDKRIQASTHTGVNLVKDWCPDFGANNGYIRIAPIIDKIIDNGDINDTKGRFFWYGSEDNGQYWFSLTTAN